jgi:ribosomal-protein-alanine N-acetyltransferase
MILADNVSIVPFEQPDLDEMMEIEVKVFPTPWSRSSYEELAPLSSIKIWVAKIEEELVGYMLYQFWGDEMELHSIAVKPEHQGRGIGTMLMDHMLMLASSMGITKVYLLVRPSNMPAKTLYKKYGFEVIGVRRHYYHDNGENALVMCREEGAKHK